MVCKWLKNNCLHFWWSCNIKIYSFFNSVSEFLALVVWKWMKMTCLCGDWFLFLSLHVCFIYFLHWGVMVKFLPVWWVLLLLDEMSKGNHWLTCFMHGRAIGRGSPASDSHVPVSWGSSPSAVALFQLWFYPSAWLGMTGMVSLGHCSCTRWTGRVQVVKCYWAVRAWLESVMLWRALVLVSFVSMGGCCVFVHGATASSHVWELNFWQFFLLNVKNLCAIFFPHVFFIWLWSLEDVSQVLGCLHFDSLPPCIIMMCSILSVFILYLYLYLFVSSMCVVLFISNSMQ